MAADPIDSLDDPRVAAYRSMKEKDLARQGRRFIAEGENVVRRLLTSNVQTESVFLSKRKVAAMLPAIPPGIPAYVADDVVIRQVTGFAFHSGVLACGIRPAPLSLQQIISIPATRPTLFICEQIANTDNLGSLIRIAAAFGCQGMILGETCCDPFFRQSVRVSMGNVFQMPLRQSDNLLRDLQILHDDYGYETLATVLANDAEPLAHVRRADKLAILFGNEAHGLEKETIARCDRKVTIPMQLGTDSLNVSVAAGIVLYHLTCIA